jgi:hypothetical protein
MTPSGRTLPISCDDIGGDDLLEDVAPRAAEAVLRSLLSRRLDPFSNRWIGRSLRLRTGHEHCLADSSGSLPGEIEVTSTAPIVTAMSMVVK